MRRTVQFDQSTPPICRLGLATRGNTCLSSADVEYVVDRGVNYLNWCGRPDGLSRAVAGMGAGRENIVLAWQLKSRTASGAEQELEDALRELNTDRIDVVTFYYVEREGEWRDIASKGGAYEAMARARDRGKVRFLGLTSHQRLMAARIAVGDLRAPEQIESRPLDMLMLRYNAAHRGAEEDVFPFTDPRNIPVVVYTCLRWGALMKPTADDPPNFIPPPAREWYRFALAHSSVAIALAAPNDRAELEHNFSLLDDWRAPAPEENAMLLAHGNRVYQHAGRFP